MNVKWWCWCIQLSSLLSYSFYTNNNKSRSKAALKWKELNNSHAGKMKKFMWYIFYRKKLCADLKIAIQSERTEKKTGHWNVWNMMIIHHVEYVVRCSYLCCMWIITVFRVVKVYIYISIKVNLWRALLQFVGLHFCFCSLSGELRFVICVNRIKKYTPSTLYNIFR